MPRGQLSRRKPNRAFLNSTLGLNSITMPDNIVKLALDTKKYHTKKYEPSTGETKETKADEGTKETTADEGTYRKITIGEMVKHLREPVSPFSPFANLNKSEPNFLPDTPHWDSTRPMSVSDSKYYEMAQRLRNLPQRTHGSGRDPTSPDHGIQLKKTNKIIDIMKNTVKKKDVKKKKKRWCNVQGGRKRQKTKRKTRKRKTRRKKRAKKRTKKHNR